MIHLLLSANVELDQFCSFLRAVQVSVDGVDGRMVDVSVPGAASKLHERRELSGYVTTWNALHPGLRVDLMDAIPGDG